MSDCKHENFIVHGNIFRLGQEEGGEVDHFQAEFTVRCDQCGMSFLFLGAPMGVDYSKPAMSADRRTLRAPIIAGGEI